MWSSSKSDSLLISRDFVVYQVLCKEELKRKNKLRGTFSVLCLSEAKGMEKMITNVPTLMVGLGGIGSEIVEKIEIQTQDRETHYKTYIRENVQYVIVDTDENSIRERKKGGYRGFSVSLSGDVSVGKCLEWDEDARENWFPTDNIFRLKSISEGAGQIRSISRLAFQRAIRVGALEPLHDAIECLFRQSSSYTNQELKVVLVSTIAGGTGSGVVLPLAMYIKEYVKNNYSASGVKIDSCLILPEVLEGLKLSRNERNNLYSNGYAALKEISYFMHKTDNNIKNDKVFIKLPNERSDEIVTHRESPFDFCFLFGRLTENKRTLGTLEDYKTVVERCIFTQFIGSYSGQFFSIEDNMLINSISGSEQRQKLGEIVLARYASANCFKVFYPYERIEEYLSMRWGMDIMAEEWTKYDNEVMKFEEEQRKKREMGINTIEQTESEGFVAAVERLKDKDIASQNIINRENKHENFSEFILKLENHIKDTVTPEMGLWAIIKNEITYLDQKDISKQAIKNVLGYYDMVGEQIELIIEKTVENIKYEVMKLHKDEKDWKDYYIEYYLKDQKRGDWKSPNEIRYFLSKIVITLDMREKSCRLAAEDKRGQFKDCGVRMEELQKSENMIKIHKGNCKKKYIKKVGVELKEICENLVNVSECLLYEEIYSNCFKFMKQYLQNILKHYQIYFQEYDDMRVYFYRRMKELEKWFNSRVQGADWLVYTSDECLEEMVREMKKKRLYFQIGGEVSKWLYQYCNSENDLKKGRNQENEMKQMWQEMFAHNYKKEFDINLFEAFSKEAACLGRDIDENVYIIQQLERAATDFSSPLLTVCRKETGALESICIYSPELDRGTSYETVKKRFFQNSKAICDDSCLDTDKRSIIFYQNRYGLESFMIDYIAADTGEYNSFPIGIGHTAYRNIVSKVAGNKEKAKLTPHIDNTWHRANIMPDINRKMEIEYMKWALKALLAESEEEDLINKFNYYIWNIAEAQSKYLKLLDQRCADMDELKEKIKKLEERIKEFSAKSVQNSCQEDYQDRIKQAAKKAKDEIEMEIGNYQNN